MQTTTTHLRHLLQTLTAIVLLLALPMLHAAEPRAITVVFFADHPMQDEQWSKLFEAIQSELLQQQNETPYSAITAEEPRLDLVRGDSMQPGIVVESAISVYLHGNCSLAAQNNLSSQSSSPHPGALGWVERTNSQITPFIHVDCALITHLLRPSALFLTADRNDLTAIAIARVFRHEWLHIKTQSPHHTHTGIEKSSFTAADLIGDTPASHPQHRRHPEAPLLLSPIHGK